MENLTMRVSAKTIPAKLASALVRHLAQNSKMVITVISIGLIASQNACEAIGIANRYVKDEDFALAIADEETPLEVEDRAFDAKPGSTKMVAGRTFTITSVASMPPEGGDQCPDS